MKHILRTTAGALLLMVTAGQTQAQFQFSNANTRLNNAAVHSGCPIAVTDWNFDGLDDIIRLDQGKSLYIEIQRTNQTFETRFMGDMNTSSGWAWAMCVADVDHNGYKDVVAGGYGPALRMMKMSNDGMSATMVSLPNSGFFLQNASFGDFNNDGWEDLFACDDNGPSNIYLNDGAGNLLESNIINFTIHPGSIGSDPNDSGNYGSVVTDFDNDGDLDLYIAKCRQASSVSDGSDPRRVNVMFVNNGDGTYTENAAEYGINIAWQTWTASFGDIDNDADLDLLLTNHDYQTQIFENDGTGHYTDITATTGVVINNMQPLQSGWEDIDNDGFIDFVISGGSNRVYRNNGNKTFSAMSGVFANPSVGAFAFGDLNHDGKIDMYTSYHTGYTTPSNTDDIIYLNTVNNNNNFITINLEGTISNKTALGARALIYGSWGVQLREVRAGESYGTVSSSALHFGLGQATEIDSVVIRWPSGITQTIENPSINQFLTITENGCVAPEALISTSGPAVFCDSNPLLMTAPAGYTYLWSTGETTQSISVSQTGEYNVRVIATENCSSVSQTINATAAPDETPSVTSVGETSFCNGGAVTLSGPNGYSSYLWSNGETTQSIQASATGNYTVTIEGACQDWTSAPVSVSVLSPEAPAADNVVISAPGSAALNATAGTNITWYSDAAATNAVGSGASFVTPEVSTTATYYMVSSVNYGGDDFNTGLAAPSGSNVYSGSNATNASLSFDVMHNCVLKTVLVDTDTPGLRTIEVKDNQGNVVHSMDVTLVTGAQTLTLDFALTPGTNYSIGTNAATNQSSLGFAGPRMKRNYAGANGTPYAYPFTASDLLQITNSSAGNLYFFYFFNWVVESELVTCSSDPVAVTVTVDESTGVENTSEALQVYPNPANEVLRIQGLSGNAQVSLTDASGRLVKTATLSNNATLDVAALPAGVYVLAVRQNNSLNHIRVVLN
jgi:hypothetical protein